MGPPAAAVMMPMGKLGGRHDGAADGVGNQQEAGAEQRRARQKISVVRADQQTQQMRHDDADKGDAAADGNRGAGRGRNDQDRHMLQPLHRHAEMGGRGLAQRHGVQPLGQKRRYDEGCQHDRTRGENLCPGRPGERAERPEGQVAQLPVIRHEDHETGKRRGHRAERDAGKQHGGYGGLAAPGSDPVKDKGHRQSAEKRGERQRVDAERAGQGRQHRRTEHDDRHRS